MESRPWSFSHLEGFDTCPRKFYETKVVKKYIEPPTVHTEWGKTVHTAFENRIKYNTPLPEGMAKWEPIATKIATLPGEKHCELPVSLDRSFRPTEWSSGWTRGVIDVAIISGNSAAVIDYKTGKRKPSDQLLLYSAYLLALYPTVEKVSTAFVWLKTEKVDKDVVKRENSPKIWATFLERSDRLASAYERNSWPERPSGLCRGWCPVKACQHNR